MEIINIETEKFNRFLLAVKISREILPNIEGFELFSYPEDFFRVLTGFDKSCLLKINNISELKRMLFFILQLRLKGGLELFIEKSGEAYLLVSNQPDSYDIKTAEPLKAQFRHYLENDSPYRSKIKHLAVLTCNRPFILKETLEKYIYNIRFYKHESITITIFDDSDEENTALNRCIIAEIQERYPDISYISRKKKLAMISNLAKECLDRLQSLNAGKIKYYIDYTFGNAMFHSTYGRNRNFISFYFKNLPFIMVDDDSSPEVLTFQAHVLLNALHKACETGTTDLQELDKYISEPEIPLTQLENVDFLGHFSSLETDRPHYVKYSGDKDINSQFYLVKQLGFDFAEAGVFKFFSNIRDAAEGLRITDLLKTEAFIYGNSIDNKPVIKGLCCYFPPGTAALRVTVPENLRIEDLILGANYLLSRDKFPVETNFAMYHKKSRREITPGYIHDEIIGGIIFSAYFNLIKELHSAKTREAVLEFYARIQTPVKLSPEAFKIIEQNKKEVLQLINNCAELAVNPDTIDELKRLAVELQAEFYSLEKSEYEARTEKYVNEILRELAGCMLLWITINNDGL